MSGIATTSFKLSIYQKGDETAGKLAIVCPGLLDPKHYPHLKGHVDYLADRGFIALSFDPPGTWGSEGSINDYTMTNYVKAIDEIIAYFGSKPTLVLGHSFGGTVSMLAAINNPYVKAFAAIMSPPSLTMAHAIDKTMDKWQKEGTRTSYRNIEQGSTEKKRFDLPYTFIEDVKKHNALDGLRRTKKPKLFIAGDKDDAVEPEVVQETHEVSAGPKELYILKSDHNYRYHPDLIDEVNEQLGIFVERYKL